MSTQSDTGSTKREFDRQLDAFEQKIEELRLLYEQYFIDIITVAPEKFHNDLKATMRRLSSVPFKNSADRFRYATIRNRFQTYETYWSRTIKQRESGTYKKDVFKAELRSATGVEKRPTSGSTKNDKELLGLYEQYQKALDRTGSATKDIQFDAFKNKLMKQAKDIKEKHGVKSVKYKLVMKDGKVSIKASLKK